MNKRKPSIEYVVRLVIVVIIIINVGYIQENVLRVNYLISFLIFILSSQIRIHFLKDRLFFMSLLVEIILACIIVSKFRSIHYLLLYIPMIDGLMRLHRNKYFVSVIVLGSLLYFLKSQTIEVMLLNGMIYIILQYIAREVKDLSEKVGEVESLYDEKRIYSYQLEGAKKRLEEYSQRVEKISQLEERNRISREIHDTIGHRLTALFMQIEAIIRVLEINSEKGKKMLLSARDNLSESIDILRQTVRNMRPKSNNSVISLIQDTIDNFISTTGIEIDFHIAGKPHQIYPSEEIILHKNAQEAITNAVRHGHASQIWVTLEYQENQIVLTVRDNGIGSKKIIKGMGITGMEERVALIGGKLQITSENGFEIKTILPIRQEGDNGNSCNDCG